MKKYPMIFGLGVIFFIAASSYSYSNICCMFSASRYYGWPYPYLSLNKTVQTLAEAGLIKTLTVPELIHRGWRFNFSGDMLKTSPFGTSGNLIFDITFSLIGAGLIVWAGKKILVKFK